MSHRSSQTSTSFSSFAVISINKQIILLEFSYAYSLEANIHSLNIGKEKMQNYYFSCRNQSIRSRRDFVCIYHIKRVMYLLRITFHSFFCFILFCSLNNIDIITNSIKYCVCSYCRIIITSFSGLK